MNNLSANERDTCEVLSDCLDNLGYSQEMIKYRRDINKTMDEIYNKKSFPERNITTGGKAEGTSLYFESDIDRLYEVKGVTCVEAGQSCPAGTVFHLERSGCAPGYTKLKLVRTYGFRAIKSYLLTHNDDIYVANTYCPWDQNAIFVDINGVKIYKKDKRGPSLPFGNDIVKYDFVFGFQCFYTDLIEKWIKRPRKYHWPDQILIDRVSVLEGHVVPVANKGSKNLLTEWRICYTRAELLLLESLTEVQIKLYIILKLLAKSVLKPVCSEMSSYIMKNIVFWMVETNPPESFEQSYLIDRLTDALMILKQSLSSNNLRSYMIEDRNLFEGRISDTEKDRLLDVLDVLIREKDDVLLRCNKLRTGLTKMKECLEGFVREGKKRDEIEKLILKTNVMFKEIQSPFQEEEDIHSRLLKNDVYKKYKEQLYKLVIPDSKEIIKRDLNLEEVYINRVSNIVS